MVYNLKDLQEEVRNGVKYEYTLFYGHKLSQNGVLNNACFSQWFTSYFEFNGLDFICMEQVMMYYKAKLFGDEDAAHTIMVCKEPRVMKLIGRRVKNFDPVVWDNASYDIIKDGNKAKFTSSKDLKTYLLNTGNSVLVEASPHDRIWGIHLGINDIDSRNPLKWEGKNKLGFALTQARDEILGR